VSRKVTLVKRLSVVPLFKLLSLAVSLRNTRFNIEKFYMALASRWVFYTDLRTNSDFCHLYHDLTGFYNSGGKCLLRGKG
jgi:hypothetical protein